VTKPLKDQPTDREQLFARVFDRVSWATRLSNGHQFANIGGWVLEVRPGVRFWDWKVGWESVKGVILAHSCGDETSELKAKRAASDALARAILSAADDLSLGVSILAMDERPKLKPKPVRKASR
jgi:hypothetical protein